MFLKMEYSRHFVHAGALVMAVEAQKGEEVGKGLGMRAEDGERRTREVVPPQRPDLILPTHIPHGELDVLVRDRLDVESHCWDGCHVLVELELIQDSCRPFISAPTFLMTPIVGREGRGKGGG